MLTRHLHLEMAKSNYHYKSFFLQGANNYTLKQSYIVCLSVKKSQLAHTQHYFVSGVNEHSPEEN